MKPHLRRMFYVVCGLLFVLALLRPGCSAPTAVDRDNRRLVDAILTAITLKNSNLLEDDAELAKKRHSAGHLTDADYEQLLAIIDQGRAGDWPSAERKGYEFRKRHPFVEAGR